MTRRLAVPLPDVVLDLLRSEAGRTGVTPNRLAAEIIREALPAWVHRRLSEALRPVLDAEEDEDADAVPPPAGAGGGTDIYDRLLDSVTLSIPPGDPTTGPPGDATP